MKTLWKLMNIFSLFLMLVYIPSCIKEDMSGCKNPVKVKFNFIPEDKNRDGYGIKTSEVENMYLFVFDSKDMLVYAALDEEIDFSTEYEMNITGLENGLYRFVSWGNYNPCYQIIPVDYIIGSTMFYELTMLVDCAEKGRIEQRKPAPLFHGGYQSEFFQIGAPTGYQQVTLELIKDTYDIHITARGFTKRGMSDRFQVSVSDDNGCYFFDNSYASGGELLYLSPCEYNPVYDLESHIRVMRIDEKRNPLLTLTNTTKQERLCTIDLVGAILLTEKEGALVDFRNQYRYDIQIIKEDDSSITIIINGWALSDNHLILK